MVRGMRMMRMMWVVEVNRHVNMAAEEPAPRLGCSLRRRWSLTRLLRRSLHDVGTVSARLVAVTLEELAPGTSRRTPRRGCPRRRLLATRLARRTPNAAAQSCIIERPGLSA
jgi:hypothetical protein